MENIRTTLIQALDIADLPQELQDDVIARTAEGVLQNVVVHACMTLPENETAILMKYLDEDKTIEELFTWLGKKMPNLGEVVIDSLTKYTMA